MEVARGPFCWLVAERDSYELLVGQTPARRTPECSTGALNAGSEPRTQTKGEAMFCRRTRLPRKEPEKRLGIKASHPGDELRLERPAWEALPRRLNSSFQVFVHLKGGFLFHGV